MADESSDARLARISTKLAAVARRTDLGGTFGAHKHQFQVAGPVPAERVGQFETEHNIELPEEYRLFLTELGHGAGPSYGLTSLDKMIVTQDLSAPSVFVSGQTLKAGWWNGHDDEDEALRGAMEIVHHGGDSYSALVVTGPGRGRVVNVNRDGSSEPYATEDEGFLAWYERWLDELAAGYAVGTFGEKLPGDESALLDIVTSETNSDRRLRAVWSLSRLPELSDAARAVVAEVYSDSDAALRRTALIVATTHGPAEIAVQALSDSDAQCRATALSALRFAHHADLATHARAKLEDEDEDVRWQALAALEASGQMRVRDLLPLQEHPSAQTRCSMMHFLAKAGGDASRALIRGLDDSDRDVRTLAVQSITGSGLRHLIPQLEKLRATETDERVTRNIARALDKLTAE